MHGAVVALGGDLRGADGQVAGGAVTAGGAFCAAAGPDIASVSARASAPPKVVACIRLFSCAAPA